MKKLKVWLVILLFLILAGGIVYLVREKNKACINYTLDEAHLLTIRYNEPQMVDQEVRSPRDNSVLKEVPLRLPADLKIKAYYSVQAKMFWILDISKEYVQWFGPYFGHPCD
jgi:hypothetical protein